jgi:hypothetical protein
MDGEIYNIYVRVVALRNEYRYSDETEPQRVTRQHFDRIADELLKLDAHNKEHNIEKNPNRSDRGA